MRVLLGSPGGIRATAWVTSLTRSEACELPPSAPQEKPYRSLNARGDLISFVLGKVTRLLLEQAEYVEPCCSLHLLKPLYWYQRC